MIFTVTDKHFSHSVCPLGVTDKEEESNIFLSRAYPDINCLCVKKRKKTIPKI
jgi:hypothetical protein